MLVNTLIYRKVLKFRLAYNKDYNEGRLVGFMQTDSQNIMMVFNIVRNYIDSIVNILIFALWGGYQLGWTIQIIVLIFAVLQWVSVVLINKMSNIQKDYMKFKDERTKQLKSAISCLPLVKVFGLEPLVFMKVTRQRMEEMSNFLSISVKRSIVSLFNWASVFFAFIVMASVMFSLDMPLTYIFVVPLTKMMMLLFYTTGLLPMAAEQYLNMSISIDRI